MRLFFFEPYMLVKRLYHRINFRICLSMMALFKKYNQQGCKDVYRLQLKNNQPKFCIKKPEFINTGFVI